MCRQCLEWHNHALNVLQGGLPAGCQDCDLRADSLKESDPLVELRMYVVPKDGIYQVLCKRCVAKYVAKRRDLYKGTKFGQDQNL